MRTLGALLSDKAEALRRDPFFLFNASLYDARDNDLYWAGEKPIEPTFRPRPIDKEMDELKSKLVEIEGKFNKYFDSKRKTKYD